MSQNGTTSDTGHDGGIWQTPDMLSRQLGVTRRTLYRKVKQGLIESCTVAGRKLYRAVVDIPPGAVTDRDAATNRDVANRRGPAPDVTLSRHQTSQDVTVPGMPDVPPNVMALVERYEDKLEAVAAERAELAGQVAQLRVDVQTERANVQTAEHKRQLVTLEAKHQVDKLQSAAAQFRAVAEQRRADAERAQREAESLRQRLEAIQTLDDTPWWAFGRRRQLHAVLAGAVLTEG